MARVPHSPRWAAVKVSERTHRNGWLRAAVSVTHPGHLGAAAGVAGMGRRPGPVPAGLRPDFGPAAVRMPRAAAFPRGSTSSGSPQPREHPGAPRKPDSPELARRLHGNGRSTQTPARRTLNKERSHWLECRLLSANRRGRSRHLLAERTRRRPVGCVFVIPAGVCVPRC